MGTILQFIESNNEGGYKCYNTHKSSLDDTKAETVTSENSDTDVTPIDTKGRFAEDDGRIFDTVKIPNSLIINTPPYSNIF